MNMQLQSEFVEARQRIDKARELAMQLEREADAAEEQENRPTAAIAQVSN